VVGSPALVDVLIVPVEVVVPTPEAPVDVDVDVELETSVVELADASPPERWLVDPGPCQQPIRSRAHAAMDLCTGLS